MQHGHLLCFAFDVLREAVRLKQRRPQRFRVVNLPIPDSRHQRTILLIIQRSKGNLAVSPADRQYLDVIHVQKTECSSCVQRLNRDHLYNMVELSTAQLVLCRGILETDTVCEQIHDGLRDKIVIIPTRNLVIRGDRIQLRTTQRVIHDLFRVHDRRIQPTEIQIRVLCDPKQLAALMLLDHLLKKCHPVSFALSNRQQILICL